MKMLYSRYHAISRSGSLVILPAVIPRPAPGPLGQMGPLCISSTLPSNSMKLCTYGVYNMKMLYAR